MTHLAILISGRGSNMQALVDSAACASADITVVANRADAAGLDFAHQRGIPVAVIEHRQFATREAFDRQLHEQLVDAGIDWVFLAGFMRILTPSFVNAWNGKLINIHPSRLPRYPGLNCHQRALDAGDSTAGASVHFVTEELDGGPVIIQSIVDILPGDTADQLAERVLVSEHRIYPLAASWVISGKARLCQDQCCFDNQPISSPIQWQDGQWSLT